MLAAMAYAINRLAIDGHGMANQIAQVVASESERVAAGDADGARQQFAKKVGLRDDLATLNAHRAVLMTMRATMLREDQIVADVVGLVRALEAIIDREFAAGGDPG